ncbi:TPM domain-containing protein [Patescibacteria group bacterium]|nr:TPM domain-containing protein [Patescibacteria group bacterium]
MFFPGRLKGRVLVLAIILFLATTNLAAAGTVSCPERPRGYVSDYAAVLGDTSQLEDQLDSFEKNTSNEIYVAVVDSLGEASGEDYTTTLFNKWNIGKENLDNGALFLVGINDRQVNIKAGYGLGSVLTGEVTKTIIDNEITPAFSTGAYKEGVEKGVGAIIATIQGNYRQELTASGGHGLWVFLIIFILVVVTVVVISVTVGQKRQRGRTAK